MATDHSNRLVFYSEPGLLQDLACLSIASYLWYCEMKNVYDEAKTAIQFSQLPTSIRNMIYKCIDAIAGNVDDWCTLNSYLFTKSENPNRCDFELNDLISWSADGTINYRQTAQKLVRSDQLNGKQKYRVACIYCFPEEIEALITEKHEYAHPLVEYWNCRMENKASSSIAESNEYSSPEAALLWKYESDDTWMTLSAFQFFWEYLPDDERMRIIYERRYYLKNFLFYALCNIEERQLQGVVESDAAQILIMLFYVSETFFMPLWNHVKTRNMITVSSFYEIMRHFVTSSAYTAFQIWMSASDELKKGPLISQNVDSLLERLIPFVDYHRREEEIELVMELLSVYPSEKREEIWNEQWKDIIVGTSPEQLQIVMKLCLGCDDKIASFKKMYMCEYSEIKVYLKSMIERKRFQEFYTVLSFLTNDTEIIYNLRIRVMKSDYFLSSYFEAWVHRSPEKTEPFDKLIDETFPDASQLEDFKLYLMISGTHASNYFLEWITEKGGFYSYAEITGFYDHVLSSTPHLLNQAKNALLKLIHHALIDAVSISFTDDLEKIVKWCVNEDIHLLNKFKETLNVDTILHLWMDECLLEFKEWNPNEDGGVFRSESLKMLKYLFRWLLEDDDKIQDFILDELNTRRFDLEIESIQNSDKKLLNALLRWSSHT